MVNSRTHGLISGLSPGIPILVTGWSHKIAILMTACSCLECLVPPTVAIDDLLRLVDKMVGEPERSHLVERLQTAVTQMWAEIQSKTWG